MIGVGKVQGDAVGPHLCTPRVGKQNAIGKAIAGTGLSGYVAHEFMPVREPLASLKEAYQTMVV
jgi:hypothetical protein